MNDIMRESVIYQDILQEGIKLGIEQRIKQAIEKRTQEIAINMINKGINLETIVDITGLSIETLQQLQAQQHTQPE